jgi:hypothetical protein
VQKLCFVVGPIGSQDSEPRIHADWLLEEIVQPVMTDFRDFDVRRADKDPRPGLIDAQVIEHLLSAELVIADLSFLNPNAFYEIGIRHMIQKPIIHMQLATETIPFDVSLYRAIKFSRVRPSDLKAARVELKEAVEAVLAADYEVVNPITSARGRMKLEENATSRERVLLDQLEAFGSRLDALEVALRTVVSRPAGGYAGGYAGPLLERFGSPGPFANTPGPSRSNSTLGDKGTSEK